ncbi:MAG: TRAP transporter large permease, partial [Bacteroidales bacterium]|nr:TRAP transporter large permease [Bacteroidales bacterium]
VSITALFLAGYVPGILTGVGIMLVAMSMMVLKNKGLKGLAGVLGKVLLASVILVGAGIGMKVVHGASVQAFKGTVYGLLLLFLAFSVYKSATNWTFFKFAFKKFIDALPSLLLLVIVIGGIVAGFFTATEASAVAVLYALILALLYKEITVKDLPAIILKSVRTTCIVLLLVATSIGMSWIMSYENIPQNVSSGLLGLSDNPIVILLVINFILLFVGIFMDMTPAVLIFTPIFLPIVTAQLGMNPIHFGIIMVLNLCVGICTPPVGSVLFIGCSVANLKIEQVIKPLLPMFIIMIVVLMLVTFIPSLSLWLPNLLMK